MKLVGRNRLDEFCGTHPNVRAWIENWIAEIEAVAWASPNQLRGRYRSASFLGGGVTIFNVKGNSYRLEALVAYKTGTVVVLWLGTHGEYDERNRKR